MSQLNYLQQAISEINDILNENKQTDVNQLRLKKIKQLIDNYLTKMTNDQTHNVTHPSLTELEPLIHQWAIDRNIDTANPKDQVLKIMEEVGELANGFNKNKPNDVTDAIGDIFAVLNILCLQLNISLSTCAANSYNVYKNRKGKIINGMFVKEEDL